MKSKSRQLDQFYTKPSIAELCLNHLSQFYKLDDFDFVLEPSAGTGGFYNILPSHNRLGIDIDPKTNEIQNKNFFDFCPEQNKKYIVVGNPPFGKNSSLAIKFFNHASTFSDVISFIVPRTFKKTSLTNKLDLNFSLLSELDLPIDSFEFEGRSVKVPCVFQIWNKTENKREKIKLKTQHEDFEFVNDLSLASFGIQRVGGNAGKIKDISLLQTLSKESHLWIKENKTDVRCIFEKIDWDLVKHNTAGNPSVSKSDIIVQYDLTKAKFSF